MRGVQRPDLPAQLCTHPAIVSSVSPLFVLSGAVEPGRPPSRLQQTASLPPHQYLSLRSAVLYLLLSVFYPNLVVVLL